MVAKLPHNLYNWANLNRTWSKHSLWNRIKSSAGRGMSPKATLLSNRNLEKAKTQK